MIEFLTDDLLTLQPLTGTAKPVGTSISLTAQSTGGLNPQYMWSFGDGSPDTAAFAGRAVFRANNCAQCHSGVAFTDSALNTFHDIGTIKPSSGGRLGGALTGLDRPTLRSVWATFPYLHDGAAATLSAAISVHQGISLNATDLDNLAAYLQQLDGTEPAAEAVGAVTLREPRAVRGRLKCGQLLRLMANSAPGAAVTYSATGLPPGPTINPSTGLISGTPTLVGTCNVIVTASEGGSFGSQSFTWTILRASYAFDFASFTSAAGLTTNGKAGVVAPVLRLTSNTSGQVGSAFLPSPIPLLPDSSFTTRFVFRVHGAADGDDGLTFIVQGVGATALGGQGNGIGYAGIACSLAIELDTDKDGGDPKGNHIGILSNGSRSLAPCHLYTTF